jgi:hypothetical protein
MGGIDGAGFFIIWFMYFLRDWWLLVGLYMDY